MKIKNGLLIKTIISTSLGIITSAHAEIDVIKKGQLKSELLSPLSVQFGGSLRPEWTFKSSEQKKYERNLHDAASRLRFTTNYELNPTTKLIGYYELGINIPKILDWEDHYVPNAPSYQQRQAYIAIDNTQLGKLSYGKQFGMQYTVIGSKSDVWDNDGAAGASSVGINAEYDGSGRARNSLMYNKDFDHFKLYANLLFPESDLRVPIDNSSDQMSFKRKNGAGLGFDYSINPNAIFSTAYSTTNIRLSDPQQEKNLKQQVLGTALTFTPNQWYLVGTASYYHDFVPTPHKPQLHNYFVGDGYGLEAFAGYSFKFDRDYFTELQPYIAADHLSLKSDQKEHINHTFIGLVTQINKSVKVYTEYTFVDANRDKSLKDMAYITVFYNF